MKQVNPLLLRINTARLKCKYHHGILCVCVCMCACAHVCVCVWMCIGVGMYPHTNTHAHASALSICIYATVCVYVYMHTYIFLFLRNLQIRRPFLFIFLHAGQSWPCQYMYYSDITDCSNLLQGNIQIFNVLNMYIEDAHIYASV